MLSGLSQNLTKVSASVSSRYQAHLSEEVGVEARLLNTSGVCHHIVNFLQIDKKLMQAAGMVTRVRNEVEIHSQLKHPAVLELYNYFEDANYVYLVVEMCHNGELNRYLKNTQTRLSENEGGGLSLVG